MIAIWGRHGFDKIVREAWQEGDLAGGLGAPG